jgi:hypothetical protein
VNTDAHLIKPLDCRLDVDRVAHRRAFGEEIHPRKAIRKRQSLALAALDVSPAADDSQQPSGDPAP